MKDTSEYENLKFYANAYTNYEFMNSSLTSKLFGRCSLLNDLQDKFNATHFVAGIGYGASSEITVIEVINYETDLVYVQFGSFRMFKLILTVIMKSSN